MQNLPKRLARDLPLGLKLGFIGAGKMAQAIMNGLINSGQMRPENIIGSDVMPNTRETIQGLGINPTTDNNEVIEFSHVVVMAVKPQILPRVIDGVQSMIDTDKLIVSIAGGLTLDTLEKLLPPKRRVVRVMPSLPAAIGCGVSAVSMGSSATEEDVHLVSSLFRTCGTVEVVPESYIDVITATCASMIGCVTIEAMADGAVKMGLPRDMATRLAAQSLMGAARLVEETRQHPAVIKDAVCSAGGMTIAALHRLEAGGYRSAMLDAIEAATNRGKELNG